MPIKIGVPAEILEGEKRVALDPGAVSRLVKQSNVEVILQSNAGKPAHFPDAAYTNATIVNTSDAIYAQADVVLKVAPPTPGETGQLGEGQILIGHLDPYRNGDIVKTLAANKVTSIAMELIPRISRAQAMDSLSSQASLAGYKSALQAAQLCPGFFPMLTTAAGTIRPAKVIIIGAGVAGLQALATARRLGAQVEAYDIRPDAREQIESLGGNMIDTGVNATGEGGYARPLTAAEQAQQAAVLAKHLTQANAVVCTAAIPGRPAPTIITADMVANMMPGAVIVDMAAHTGGNCELTQKNETIITQNDVTIAGPVNIPSSAPLHASEMYAKNLLNLLHLMLQEGELAPDWSDDILAGMDGHSGACLTRDGEIQHAGVKTTIGT